MIASDHSPMIPTIVDKIPRGKRCFRFDTRWIGKRVIRGEGKFVENLTIVDELSRYGGKS